MNAERRVPVRWVVSPTFDWKPSRAFPVIAGAYHWATFGDRWERLAHGFTDTFEQAQEAVAMPENWDASDER